MQRADLVQAVAHATGLSPRQSNDVIAIVTEHITNALARGEDVALTGFGRFTVRQRSARKGRHPGTGAEIDIPASNIPCFKAGKTLLAVTSKVDTEDSSQALE